MNYISNLNFQISNPKGFTLIELLVVFSLIGILTAVGIASFSNFSNNQSVQNASADVLNMLTTAQSRAVSQSKPSQCGTNALRGYRVTFAAPTYTLSVLCGTSTYVVKSQDLPNGVTFATGSTSTFTFAVLNGTANPGTVTVSGYGKNEVISVSAAGTISSN